MQSAANAGSGNIVLIGMRGCGKTSLGRQLALQSGRPFLDLDDEVGALAGRTADELLAQRGEGVFRDFEARALAAACQRSGHVIATGGGAVLHASGFAGLAATGTVIYLQASLDALLARSAARPRPALTSLAAAEEVAALFAEREPLYRRAAHIVVPVEVGDPILALLAALQDRN